jgi:hypothetical protein
MALRKPGQIIMGPYTGLTVTEANSLWAKGQKDPSGASLTEEEKRRLIGAGWKPGTPNTGAVTVGGTTYATSPYGAMPVSNTSTTAGNSLRPTTITATPSTTGTTSPNASQRIQTIQVTPIAPIDVPEAQPTIINNTTTTTTQPSGFNMEDFLARFQQSQDERAAQNAAASAASQQQLIESLRSLNQPSSTPSSYEQQILDLMREQQNRQAMQYQERLNLNAGQIANLDREKAAIEQRLRDAEARYLAESGNIQSQTGVSAAQVLRDYAGERERGLLNLAARNRGIDPSASRRFLSDLAAGKATALAQTQSSGLEQLRSLKNALDAQQFSSLSGLADLSRLRTQLGTTVEDYFPGVVY